MSLSALKSYLPCTSKRAMTKEVHYDRGFPLEKYSLDKLKIASKVTVACSLALAGSMALSYACNPDGPCDAEHFGRLAAAGFEIVSSSLISPLAASLTPVLGLTLSICHSELGAIENANIDKLITDKNYLHLLPQIIRSPSAMNKLLEQTRNNPQFLEKMRLDNRSLLVAYRRDVVEKCSDVYWNGSLMFSSWNSYQLDQSQKILRKLLVAAQWPIEDLFACFRLTDRKLLASWPEVREKIAQRNDLTSGDRITLEAYFKTEEA